MNTILLNENKLLSSQNKKLKELLSMYQKKYGTDGIEVIETEKNEMELIINESSKLNEMLGLIDYEVKEEPKQLKESICRTCDCNYVYCKWNKQNINKPH